MMPLMPVVALLVMLRRLLEPASVTEPENNNGVLPLRLTLALLNVTALLIRMPPLTLVDRPPLVNVNVPVPMAAVLPRFRLTPSSATVPEPKRLGLSRLTVAPPASVRLVAV